MSSQHVAVVRISRGLEADAITVVSAYFKYNVPTHHFIEKLRTILMREARTLIGADVNGHSLLWHCPTGNNRGLQTEELIEDFDLTVANRPGQLSTYEREGMGASNIDVTLLTPQVRDMVSNWMVSDTTDSDHRVISYSLSLNQRVPQIMIPCRFNTRKADWRGFANNLSRLKPTVDRSTIDTQAHTIIDVIRRAAVASIPRIRKPGVRAGRQPWWNEQLTSLKKDLCKMRRQGKHRSERQAYNQARNQYLYQVRTAKAAAWRNFANDININPWGKAFSWAKRGPKSRTVPSTMMGENGAHTSTLGETAELLLSSFFPREGNKQSFTKHGPLLEYEEPVDQERVKAAIWRMRPGKAPGLDGITAGMLRKAWPILADDITKLFGDCMKDATFPRGWKDANLVVIPKPGKADMANPKSYRPVSLLPTLSKALETLIIQDLVRETDLDSYSPQHGFVPGRSTITAIKAAYDWTEASKSRHVVGVFLDITGAFDNVGWHPMLKRLDELGASVRTLRMVGHYLSGRTASLMLQGERYSRTIERGCPQGSQLGPTLWKVAMTGLDKIKLDASATTILYADDIALLVGAARPQTAFTRIEGYLEKMLTWAEEYELRFSPAKTQMMSVKGGLKPGYDVGFGTRPAAPRIVASGTVKYLGVHLDPRCSFWEHVKALKSKSEGLYVRLRRMTSANWGMGRLAAKIIYEAVFLPRITYAAEIWAEEGCGLKKSINALCSMQRSPLLAITSCYRTASTNCLSAVAGVLPLDLEVRRVTMKCRLRNGTISSQEYEDGVQGLIAEWQTRYDETDKGEWTKIMIPDLARRCALPLKMDHYTAQFLTGHGDFNAKLHGFKLVRSANCACGNGAETVRHVLLACTRTRAYREDLITVMREEQASWPPEKGAFLSTRRTYEALRKFSRKCMTNRTDR
ncbi:unnamed protein product [Macrosiphum euphorbiae]|uniref:Reverse transcriptase domain-containing protein n=2 Tax=Macrosiphum euphorbiae TaxID=13131 RepID=A0AAV0VKN2_9HEMI|nr:unnamed protein product [Macrosiphum euphorbiae]